jgi:hypothetical protein
VAMYAISLQRSIHARLQSPEWRQTIELKLQKEQEVRNLQPKLVCHPSRAR